MYYSALCTCNYVAFTGHLRKLFFDVNDRDVGVDGTCSHRALDAIATRVVVVNKWFEHRNAVNDAVVDHDTVSAVRLFKEKHGNLDFIIRLEKAVKSL